MSQQLLECSGSLRDSEVCLMHPVLLELTPTSLHTGPRVACNEEEGCVKGTGTARVLVFEVFTLQTF